MKYCKKCGLSVRTNDSFCPLCASKLTAEKNENEQAEPENDDDRRFDIYPKTVMKVKYNFIVRLLLFLSIVAASTCLLINILAYHGILWSLLVSGGIGFFWAAFVYPFLAKKNIGHFITVDVVCACLFFIIAQFITKSKGWSLDYVIPFLFIAATTIISFITLIRRMKWREYALYQFITIILGVLPVISVIAGLVIIGWPSIASAFYSFITLIGMLIFANKKYKNELIKRFHF
jgi:hypothetical protein